MLQANLERSLERLNIENEKDWIAENMEYDQYGRMNLGQKFNRFRNEMTQLQSVLEKNLNRTMQDIREGLPEVQQEDEDDDTDFELTGQWTCSTC